MKHLATCSLPDVYFSILDSEVQPITINEHNKKYIHENFEKRTDRTWNELALELLSIKRELRELQQREQEIKDLLVGMSGLANSIGGGIQVQKIVKKGVVQYSDIPQLKGIDLEKYRKPPTGIRSCNIAQV